MSYIQDPNILRFFYRGDDPVWLSNKRKELESLLASYKRSIGRLVSVEDLKSFWSPTVIHPPSPTIEESIKVSDGEDVSIAEILKRVPEEHRSEAWFSFCVEEDWETDPYEAHFKPVTHICWEIPNPSYDEEMRNYHAKKEYQALCKRFHALAKRRQNKVER